MTDYTDILTRLENFGYGTTNPEVTKRAAEAIKALVAERDAAFAMSRCECESNEACKNLVALHDEVERLKSALREVVKAFDVVEIDSDECLDFDECTAMFVPLDAYHGISEAITTIRTALGEEE